MSQVISSASTSLDGFIAYRDNTVGPWFDWYTAGDEQVTSASADVSFRLTPASAEYWRSFTARIGALVVGRDLFDFTDGWRGTHPLGVPVVVLTHEPPVTWHYPGAENFHFVTTGIHEAVSVATRLADGKDVSVAAGTIASQALAAGLLDLVAIDLVPVVLGSGRPYFTPGIDTTVLGNPTTVIQSERVTHLVVAVSRSGAPASATQG